VRRAAEDWVAWTAAQLTALRPPPPTAERDNVIAVPAPQAHLVRDQERYEADIAECHWQLVQGESYEICLTNKLRLPFDDDDSAFYRRLRRANPAPYAALLRIGEVTVFSSSPERFLRIERDGLVESKPIKGTAARSADPVRDAELARELAASPKTQAENLMIVDLLRNDLSMVCDPGTVSVPVLMEVESYPSVHQLVSTVRGRLRDGVGTVAALRALFPAGSMTGAPKLRTMQVIEDVETSPRGVYAGAFGWVGADGRADLGVVIRSLVATPGGAGWRYDLGTGGGITVRSDVEGEHAETRWKAERLLRALEVSAGR
jgi:para-aminobenzoate synthetase